MFKQLRAAWVMWRACWHARRVQDFLWGTHSHGRRELPLKLWIPLLEKRLSKLHSIDDDNPHWQIEAKKRLLQLAALSIAVIEAFDEGKINTLY